MRHLIKNAKVISKGSPHNGKRVDILVKNGVIASIAKNIEDSKAREIRSKNLHVSIGWLDVGTHIGEPGYEHRETTKSLCKAAMAGGYTDLAPFATSLPTIQSKSQVIALIHDAQQYGVQMHPIGALSIDRKGENIAEYLDMAAGGAVAYSDGLRSIQKNGLLLRALQYSQANDSLIIHHPTDHALDNDMQVHEGAVSIKMGIKGSPDIAEHMIVERDLILQQYTNAKLCLHAISSKDSVDKIKKAKTKTDKLYSSVAYLNLLHTDTDMLDFDTNLKVKPVLRGTADRSALVRGLQSGTIDCLVTNHVPLEPEAKQVEFPYATSGATGLETLYGAVNTAMGDKLAATDMVELLAINSRRMLGITVPELAEGHLAKLTCWDPSATWSYTSDSKYSKSSNSPLLNREMQGRVVACISGEAAHTL